MPSADALFMRIITRVRALLHCDIVYLELTCPEYDLAHPLLRCVNEQEASQHCYGKPVDWEDTNREAVQALYDIALQMGVPWIGNAARLPGQDNVGSIAVIPLGGPGGILGALVCMDARPEAFHYGEMQLLEQYLPRVVRQVLEGLVALCQARGISQWQEEAPHVSNEQYEFLSLLCHELRRPMTALKGYTELFLSYGNEMHKGLDWSVYLSMVREKTQQLETLINDVQDVVRMSKGYLQVCSRPVNIVRLCREMVESERARLEQIAPGDYRLCLEVANGMPLAWADPARLRQVLANLLDNAIKYSPHGGLIELLVTDQAPYLEQSYYVIKPERKPYEVEGHDRQYLYITVHDHGVGIPRHLQQILFRPFTRLEHNMQERVPGNGLGLYLVLLLVEGMSGRLLLQSDEGHGTSITLALPVAHTHMMNEMACEPFNTPAAFSHMPARKHMAMRLS